MQCATAPRGADPWKLIAEQIHAVTGAVATVVSTFDPNRSELAIRHIVMKEPLRASPTGSWAGMSCGRSCMFRRAGERRSSVPG